MPNKVELGPDGLPLPDYKIVEITDDDGDKGPGCPHCMVLLSKMPTEYGGKPHLCCSGQAWWMLRSQVVKVADLMEQAEKTGDETLLTQAISAFMGLAEGCR